MLNRGTKYNTNTSYYSFTKLLTDFIISVTAISVTAKGIIPLFINTNFVRTKKLNLVKKEQINNILRVGSLNIENYNNSDLCFS